MLPKPSDDSVYCSQDCYDRYRRAGHFSTTPKVDRHCGTCGAHFQVYPSRLREGRGKFCSKSCAMRGRPIRGRSKIASAAIVEYRRRQPHAPGVTEHRVWRWSIDLAFPDRRLAIELDGEYWHSLPDMVEKDQRKDAYLESRGWRVVRIVIHRDDTPEVLADQIERATDHHLERKVSA